MKVSIRSKCLKTNDFQKLIQKLVVNQIYRINKWTHASNVPFLSSFSFSSHGANVDGRDSYNCDFGNEGSD